MEDLLLTVMAWLFCACAAAAIIASNRGDNAAEFFFIGLFLGPFGALGARTWASNARTASAGYTFELIPAEGAKAK
jgi:hypothetical protein